MKTPPAIAARSSRRVRSGAVECERLSFGWSLSMQQSPFVRAPTRAAIETCILATHANTGKHAFNLLAPVGLNPLDDACGPSILLTILPSPSLDFRITVS